MIDKYVCKYLLEVHNMQKWLNIYRDKDKMYKQFSADNQNAIDAYNKKALATLLPIGWILTLLPLAAAPFSNTKINAVPAYLLTFLSFFILFIMFKIPAIKNYTLVGLYISFSILFVFGLYLSVIHSPNMRATILLGGFILMPISFIEPDINPILCFGYNRVYYFQINKP